MAGSESDALRMSAEIVDRFSKPLKDLQRSMRSLAAETSSTHKLGAVQAGAHTEQLYKLRREVGEVAGRVKSGLTPALAGLGISSLGAAAGIAAVTKSLVDFAGNARHLQFMSKQTQLTINQLRAWEQEASRLETTSESLTGGFVTFNEQMEKMRRGGPFVGVRREIEQIRSTLGVWQSGAISGLVQSLQGLPREAQLEKILKFADKIDNISQRRKFLGAFGLDPALSNKQSAEVLKDLDAIHKALGDLTPQQLKAGTEFQEAIENIKTSLTGLRDAVGAGLAEGVKGVAEEVAKFAANKENIAALNEAIKALGGGLGELLKAFKSFTDSPELKSFENFLNTMNNFRPGLWLRDWIGGKGTQKPHEFLKEFTDPHGPPVLDLPPVPVPPASTYPPAGQGYGGGRSGGGGADTRPLWRRLWDMTDNEAGGIQPASFQVPGDWVGALKSGGGGGGGDPRTAEGIIERGTLAALRDFAAEQKGQEGGGGGGGMGAIRANYSPGGGGGYSGAGAGTGEPAAGPGGAGTGPGGTPPMGKLPGMEGGGAPQYPTSVDQLGGGAPGKGDPRGMLSAVRQAAIKHGINPDLMERVARSEGLGAAYGTGDRGTSFGAMQLHRGGRGSVGTEFERDTGLNLADPKNERAAIDYAAGYIAKHGWGAWMGARAHGITGRMGVGIDTSRWSGELNNRKLPHFDTAGVRRFLERNNFTAGGGSGPFKDLPAAPGHSPQLASVDPRLREILSASKEQFEKLNPGFSVAATSGRRTTAGPHSSRTGAIDTQIFGPHGALSNEGSDPSGLYHQYARIAYGEMLARHPDLKGRFAWGGAFPTRLSGQGPPDLMHFDLSGERGRWGQNWMSRMGALPGLTYGAREQIKEAAKAIGDERAAAGVKSGILPFGESPTAEELHKMTGEEALHGDALRRHFGHRAHPDLLSAGQRSGLIGPPLQHKVTGSATLDVNFNNAPQGTTHRLKADGMFKQIKLSRGRAMPPAHQDG